MNNKTLMTIGDKFTPEQLSHHENCCTPPREPETGTIAEQIASDIIKKECSCRGCVFLEEYMTLAGITKLCKVEYDSIKAVERCKTTEECRDKLTLRGVRCLQTRSVKVEEALCNAQEENRRLRKELMHYCDTCRNAKFSVLGLKKINACEHYVVCCGADCPWWIWRGDKENDKEKS